MTTQHLQQYHALLTIICIGLSITTKYTGQHGLEWEREREKDRKRIDSRKPGHFYSHTHNAPYLLVSPLLF